MIMPVPAPDVVRMDTTPGSTLSSTARTSLPPTIGGVAVPLPVVAVLTPTAPVPLTTFVFWPRVATATPPPTRPPIRAPATKPTSRRLPPREGPAAGAGAGGAAGGMEAY